MRLLLDRDLNAFGNRKLNWMRIAQREDHVLAFHLGAIADAHDVEILLESGRDAGHRVGHERARQPVQRAVFFGVALGDERAVFLLEPNSRRHADVHLALGALHFHSAVLHLNLYAGRHRNHFVSNSRHGSLRSSLLRNSIFM